MTPEEKNFRQQLLRALIHATGMSERILDEAMDEISMILKRFRILNRIEVWAGNQDLKIEVERILRRHAERLTIYLQNQISGTWEAVEKKNDSLLEKALKAIGVTVAAHKVIEWFGRMVPEGFDRSTRIDLAKFSVEKDLSPFPRYEAPKRAFMERKINGFTLSKRVWNLQGQNMELIESALVNGISEGKSAAKISQDLRQYLKEPNKLFRRVRDKKTGKLVLSKAAEAYTPGQGVYRSSYKNAMRLAREEINMAYRAADHERWKDSDLLTGIKVEISAAHFDRMPDGDICDELAGNYPKDFFFTGWHVQCLCHATPVLISQEDLIARLTGEPVRIQKTEMPENFKAWLKQNKEKIEGWKSQPYFLKYNQDKIQNINN